MLWASNSLRGVSPLPPRATRLGRGAGAYAEGYRERLAHGGQESRPENDATLAHKVETEIFRSRDVPKGGINVNAQYGDWRPCSTTLRVNDTGVPGVGVLYQFTAAAPHRPITTKGAVPGKLRGTGSITVTVDELERQFGRLMEAPANDAESAASGSREWTPEVEAALRALPEVYRAAVLLVDVQELSHEEAADVLGVPLGTAQSRVFRGRRLLYAALHDYARRAGYLKQADA